MKPTKTNKTELPVLIKNGTVVAWKKLINYQLFMRFILYPILLCFGLTANCQAQIFSELGFSGGIVFPYVTKENALATTIMSGGTGAINIHTNFQNRAPLYFTLGSGLGVTHFATHEQINARDNNLDRTITFGTIQISPGVQYKKSISENASWRLGLEVSGAYDFSEREAQPYVIPRLYAGFMIDNFVSLGLNYAKPINNNGYTTFDVKGFYWGNTYGIHTYTFDLRFKLPEKVRGQRRGISKREEFRLKREELKRWREERRARRR